jgi:hypothetical protein
MADSTTNPLPGIPYGAEIAAAAERHHLDPVLLAAVAQQESQFGRLLTKDGRGDYGHGYGIFQLDDQRRPGLTPRPQADLDRAVRDPAYAADRAAQMLSDNLAARHGNMHEALSMYNAGSPHATGTKTYFPEDGVTRGYADAVEHRAGILREHIAHAKPLPSQSHHIVGSLTHPHEAAQEPIALGKPGETTATFIRNQHKLVITTPDGTQHAFTAYNNVVHPDANPFRVGGEGPAPDGRFKMSGHVEQDAGHRNVSFGPVGFEPVTDAKNHLNERGIGLHSGRNSPASKTEGCIRTTDEAMRLLAQHPAKEITIEDGLTQPKGYTLTGRIVRVTEDRVVQMNHDGKTTTTYPIGELDRVPAVGSTVKIEYGEHGATVNSAHEHERTAPAVPTLSR